MLAIILIAASCTGKVSRKELDKDAADSVVEVKPQYAKGFTVRMLDNGIRLVDVKDPQKSKGMTYHFALVNQGMEATDIPEGYTRIDVPVRRTILMTMLQLSNFTILNAHDVVKGITGTKNLFNKDILQRVKKGEIVKIGMEGNFDPELVMAAAPEIIFISPFKRGGYDAIKETGVTLVPHLGYKELDPLGQAEWIKFVAMFIGKEKEANKIFSDIADRYNSLKAKVEAVGGERPSIFSGEMHGGNWHAVGGKNYLAQIFRDAGADYVIDDDNTGGLPIDFEAMYAKAAKADYWRILNSYSGEFSYEALQKSEPRNVMFKAFRDRKVIYCNMKTTPYYEISPVMPDKVLADFIAIFHPEVMPKGYTPTFYKLL
ncbi:MAG: ABC transporter substrate-binding protein [Prevotellaceae bacterium]|nr:ABC transporter substrate-binding protein [Prevotellaceae bacterium]